MQVLGPPVAGGLSIYLEEQNILISKDGGAPGEPKWKAFATFPSLYSSYLILLPPNNPLFIKPSTKHSGLTISSGLPLPLKAPVKVIFVIFFFSLIFLLLIKSNSPAGESRREGEKDFFFLHYMYIRASLVAQLVKNPSLIPGSGRSAGEGIGYPLQYFWASLVVQMVKNPPAIQKTWVLFLGWEDSLERGTATHSSILGWRIPWTV